MIAREKALDALEDELCDGRAEVVALGMFDWGKVSNLLPAMTAPRLARLLPATSQEDQYSFDRFLDELAALSPAERLALMEDFIVAELAAIMQTSPDRIDRTKSVENLGIDSLMLMELLALLQQRFRLHLSVMDLAQGFCIATLAELAVEHIGKLLAARDSA